MLTNYVMDKNVKMDLYKLSSNVSFGMSMYMNLGASWVINMFI